MHNDVFLGSDDAKAPSFPPHVYGSRAEAPPGAVGIYSKHKTSPPPVSNDLCTIEEVTSSASVSSSLSFKRAGLSIILTRSNFSVS
jgi:hypothetical protein